MLCTIWGTRLTYNFWRKGGYKWTGEDYRWKIIQDGVNPIAFQIFNFVFIAFIQNILLGSLLSPVYAAWASSYDASGRMTAPLNAIDAIATALGLAFIIMEAVADQQQWEYQNKKRAAIASGKRLTGPVSRGFLEDGLFKYSRHPNFFAEQAFWWTLSLFATAATGRWLGWWLGGAIALTALFQGSTWLTEKISCEKYPKYNEYKKYTSRLMPWFPGKRPPKRQRRRSSASPFGRAAAEHAEDYHTPGALLVEEEEELEFPDIPLGALTAPGTAEEEAPATRGRGRPPARRQSSAKKPAPSRSRSKAPKAPVVAEPEEEEEEPKPAPRRRSVAASASTKPAAAAAPAAKKPAGRGRSRSTGGEKAAAAVAEKSTASARGRSASAKGARKSTVGAEKKEKAPSVRGRGRPPKVVAAPEPVAEAAPRRATRARRA